MCVTACASDFPTSTPTPVGSFPVSPELASAVISTMGAAFFANRFNDDKEVMEAFAGSMEAIGDDYCQTKLPQLQAIDTKSQMEARELPLYVSDGQYKKSAALDAYSGMAPIMRQSLNQVPADSIGDRCRIIKDISVSAARAASSAVLDAEMYEEALEDAYLNEKLKAMNASVSQGAPNFLGAFAQVGQQLANNVAQSGAGFAANAKAAGYSWAAYANQWNSRRTSDTANANNAAQSFGYDGLDSNPVAQTSFSTSLFFDTDQSSPFFSSPFTGGVNP